MIKLHKYGTFESVEETIRVSCAGLARIVKDGKFLTILNKNSVKVGKPSYGPLGGALEFNEESKDFLLSLGCTFEKEPDLRIKLSTKNLKQFQDWFYTKKGRETSSVREVFEEMCLEEKVTTFDPDTLIEEYRHTKVEDKLSHRMGQEGVRTIAMYEVYDVLLPDDVWVDVLDHIENHGSESKLLLASAEDLLKSPMFGSHCKHIL